jgi:hypothetical protein
MRLMAADYKGMQRDELQQDLSGDCAVVGHIFGNCSAPL